MNQPTKAAIHGIRQYVRGLDLNLAIAFWKGLPTRFFGEEEEESLSFAVFVAFSSSGTRLWEGASWATSKEGYAAADLPVK